MDLSPIQQYLNEMLAQFAGVRDGTVANYIPELSKADPDWFACSLVTVDGHVYSVGDAETLFTIQSISKPFAYATALTDCGKTAVLNKIGVEPSGDAFNAISLDPETGQPLNPMINAGAIATTALVAGKSRAGQWQRILQSLSTFAGRELSMDEAVYLSESNTGFRNRAIGFMLKNFGIIDGDPLQAVDNYFRQCSISVTSRDLGVMAATLANGGLNPVTDTRALPTEYVPNVLAVMGSCGMYDYAGGWLYEVGMPAKSGVSGGILAVLPGRLGIGVFSPPLDEKGNSVRGIRLFRQLSSDLGLHLFSVVEPVKLVIGRTYTGSQITSHRERSADDFELLRSQGQRIRVFELQGELTFDTTEVVVRSTLQAWETADFVILDLKRVVSFDRSACKLLADLAASVPAGGKQLLFSHTQDQPLLQQFVTERLGDESTRAYRTFSVTDAALEWCEDQILGRDILSPPIALTEFELFRGLTAAELTCIQSRLKTRSFRQGRRIVTEGEMPKVAFYFLISGQVSVTVPDRTGGHRRLNTLTPGMSFGEMATLEGTVRSATVTADTDVQCHTLSPDAFQELGERHPRIKIVLLENLARSLSRRLRRANRVVAALEE